MNCEESQQYIIQYVVGELDSIPDVSQLEHHIAGCDTCHNIYDKYLALNFDLHICYSMKKLESMENIEEIKNVRKSKIKSPRE